MMIAGSLARDPPSSLIPYVRPNVGANYFRDTAGLLVLSSCKYDPLSIDRTSRYGEEAEIRAGG